jgi:hypothetical protein
MITGRRLAVDSLGFVLCDAEVHVTDVLVPVLVPYARFVECRARRFGIVTELTQPDAERPISVAISPAPTANEERAGAAVRVLVTGLTAGVVPRS